MTKLIQIKQRIKAIETIKKVTHAMRLISMSTHSRLRSKQEPLRNYRIGINQLFAKVLPFAPDWTNETMSPEAHETTLFILVGSQKGLCGVFNTHLFTKFIHTVEEDTSKHFHTVAIGKKIVESYLSHFKEKPILSFEDFSHRNMSSIASAIIELIVQAPNPFSRVVMVSNEFTGFFIQRPRETVIIPFSFSEQVESLFQNKPKSDMISSLKKESELKHSPSPIEGYLWYQEPKAILDLLAQQYIEAELQSLLFESLLAEHAARFISMDNATRNAETLLEETKADYNKLRQAKITKELTELSSSF